MLQQKGYRVRSKEKKDKKKEVWPLSQGRCMLRDSNQALPLDLALMGTCAER
jgi:hypothetical protein